MKDKFQAQAQSDLTQTFSDSAMAQDPGNPTLVDEEISAQIEFFKKIKFKYLEQEAKETFLKLILADDPVQIDREDNQRLEHENNQSKHTLKHAKNELESLRNEVSRVAEEVATGTDSSSTGPRSAAVPVSPRSQLTACSSASVCRPRSRPTHERCRGDGASDA